MDWDMFIKLNVVKDSSFSSPGYLQQRQQLKLNANRRRVQWSIFSRRGIDVKREGVSLSSKIFILKQTD